MTKVLLTLQEFLDLDKQDDIKPYREFVGGEVFQKPMPNLDHARIQRFVLFILTSFLREKGIGEVLPEFRCIFGPETRRRAYVPDLCFVLSSRLTDEMYLYGAPDLAIEVLSPDHHRSRLLEKVQAYLLYGTRLVWIIDPETKTVTAESPGTDPRVLGTDDVLDGGEVLPGFSVPVAEIFSSVRL
jgi:Uma2 family endonuclease